jgi:hypothetical protein
MKKNQKKVVHYDGDIFCRKKNPITWCTHFFSAMLLNSLSHRLSKAFYDFKKTLRYIAILLSYTSNLQFETPKCESSTNKYPINNKNACIVSFKIAWDSSVWKDKGKM